jgi:hypothetical protein
MTLPTKKAQKHFSNWRLVRRGFFQVEPFSERCQKNQIRTSFSAASKQVFH